MNKCAHRGSMFMSTNGSVFVSVEASGGISFIMVFCSISILFVRRAIFSTELSGSKKPRPIPFVTTYFFRHFP